VGHRKSSSLPLPCSHSPRVVRRGGTGRTLTPKCSSCGCGWSICVVGERDSVGTTRRDRERTFKISVQVSLHPHRISARLRGFPLNLCSSLSSINRTPFTPLASHRGLVLAFLPLPRSRTPAHTRSEDLIRSSSPANDRSGSFQASERPSTSRTCFSGMISRKRRCGGRACRRSRRVSHRDT
jgi:hypothetical protein